MVPPPEISPPQFYQNQSNSLDDYFYNETISQLETRDYYKSDTKNHIMKIRNIIERDLCFDSGEIDYLSNMHRRINDLKEGILRLENNGTATNEEINETKIRTKNYSDFFNCDFGRQIQHNYADMEQKTNRIVSKNIPQLIANYEKELLLNNELKKKMKYKQ